MRVEPAKKLTLLTVPLLSLAVALTVTFAGAVNVAPLVGALSDTVGGVFAARVTVNVSVAEFPAASRAVTTIVLVPVTSATEAMLQLVVPTAAKDAPPFTL